MVDKVQYQRGYADRVMDVFGTTGFMVSEDGRLGYYGPDILTRGWPNPHPGSFYAEPGDWVVRGQDGLPKLLPALRSSQDYQQAVAMRVNRSQIATGSPSGDELEGLTLQIADWEQRNGITPEEIDEEIREVRRARKKTAAKDSVLGPCRMNNRRLMLTLFRVVERSPSLGRPILIGPRAPHV